jgi:hypothetical protein
MIRARTEGPCDYYCEDGLDCMNIRVRHMSQYAVIDAKSFLGSQ